MDQLDLFADAEEIPATFAARPAPAPTAAPRPAVVRRGVARTGTARPTAPVSDALFADPRPPRPAAPAPLPARVRSIAGLSRNPREAGRELGEAVAEAWNSSSHGNHRMDIPVSIVAALAMFPIKGYTEDVTRIIANCTDWELIQGYREIYFTAWSHRPELAARMAPLMSWLGEDDHDLIYPVRRVTETAIRYGVLELTGSPDPGARSDTDLLSWTITSLRSHGARQGLGEYHTPPELCDVMARMIIGEETPRKGMRFNDPAGGTGGMIRAAAQHLRNLHMDPADFEWAITDIDPLAAACAAVNAIVWGLGQNVLVSCGNTLAVGDLPDQAAREKVKLIEERDELLGRIAVAEAYRDAIALADRLIKGERVA